MVERGNSLGSAFGPDADAQYHEHDEFENSEPQAEVLGDGEEEEDDVGNETWQTAFDASMAADSSALFMDANASSTPYVGFEEEASFESVSESPEGEEAKAPATSFALAFRTARPYFAWLEDGSGQEARLRRFGAAMGGSGRWEGARGIVDGAYIAQA